MGIGMKLEDQVVSLELAKKLKELGVKQESAFHWMRPTFLDAPTGHILKTDQQLMDIITSPKTIARDETWEHLSAFSVAELGEMLPPDTPSENTGKSAICWMMVSENGDETHWDNVPGRDGITGIEDPMLINAKTEADARAKMLIYLIGNGLMKEKGS